MAGREIVSVEGVATQNMLHPVQEKLVEGHGSQCGYCTPGFVMSLFEGYYRGDIREPDHLDDQLCGNLCRCTGYRPIREAACGAFPERHRKNGQDSFAERLKKPAPALGAAEYEFGGERFYRPASLGGLLQLLAEYPQGRLIAGATELGLDITKRFQKFSTLISVEAVPELKEIQRTDSEWRIGGAVTLTQIEEEMAGEFPALADMLRVFGSRQVRNRATMGGNLVTASPIGDSAPLLLALDAKVVLGRSRVGQASRLSSAPAMGKQAGRLLHSPSAPSRSTSSSSPTARRLCVRARFSRRSLCPASLPVRGPRASVPGTKCPNDARWTSVPWQRASR